MNLLNKIKTQSKALRQELLRLTFRFEAPRHVVGLDTVRVAVLKARSVSEKLVDLQHCLEMCSPKILLISETWERPKLAKKIENFCEMNKLLWIQKPRTDGVGGGVAVVVDNDFGHVEQLDVDVPPEVKVVWAVVTPHARKDMKITCCAFYSSTNKAYRPEIGLIESHVFEVISHCSARFNDVSIYVGGDINSRNTVSGIGDLV